MTEMSEFTSSCCVKKCPNKLGIHGVRFFAFPSSLFRPIQRNQWIQAIQRVNGTSWSPTSISEVCSDHFVAKEPHLDSENKDFAPSLFNLDGSGSEIRQRTLTMKQFALEYIRHDDLLKNPVIGPMSDKRKRAYRLLSESLNISIKKVLAWEKRLRNFLEQVAMAQSRSGTKKRLGHTRTAAWVKIVEQKLLTVQAYKENKASAGSPPPPARVAAALRAAAGARGQLCCSPLYADVRRALRLPVALNDLHVAWVKIQQASLNELAASSRMGDWPPFATTGDSMKVADLVLMHTDVDTHRLINDESIFLYDEAKALQLLVQLIHTHQCEGDMPNRVRAQRWTRLYKEYLQSGRVVSLVALQRRWHELALQARARLASYWRQTRRPHARAVEPTLDDNLPFPAPIHIQIIKRYPHIALKPFTSWRKLVACGTIIPQPLPDQELNELELESPLPAPAIATIAKKDFCNRNFKKCIHQDNGFDSKTIETCQQSDDSESELFIIVEHSVKNEDQNAYSDQNIIHTVSRNQDQNGYSDQTKIHTVSQNQDQTKNSDQIKIHIVSQNQDQNYYSDQNKIHTVSQNQDQNYYSDQNKIHTVSQNQDQNYYSDQNEINTVSQNQDQTDYSDQNKIHIVSQNQDQNYYSDQNEIHTVSQNEENILCPTIAALNKINPKDCRTEICFSSDSDDEIEPLSEDVKVQIALPNICNRLVFTDDVDSEFNINEDSNNTGFDKKLLMDARVNLVRVDTIFKHLQPGTSLNISEYLNNTKMHRKTVNNDDFDKIKYEDGIEENLDKTGGTNNEFQVIKENMKKALKRNFVKGACLSNNYELFTKSDINKIASKETDFDIECKTENISMGNHFKLENTGTFKINYYNSIENRTDFKTKTTIDETSGAKSDIYKNRLLSNQIETENDDTDDELTIDVNYTNEWNDSDGTGVAKVVEVTNKDEVRRNIFTTNGLPILKDWDDPAENETTASRDLGRSSPTKDIMEILRDAERIRKKREQEVDFINKMPTEKQLESLLDELSFATPIQQGMYHKQCCLARRSRDCSDQRAYSGDPPLSLHFHKNELCNCCCQYLCARMATIKHNVDRLALFDEITALIKKASITAIKKKIQQLNTKSAKAIEASATMLNSLRLKKQASSSTGKTQEKTQLATKDISVTNLKSSAIPLKKSMSVELLPKSATSVDLLPKAVTSVEPSILSSSAVERPMNLSKSAKLSTKSSKSVDLSTKSSTSEKLSKDSSTSVKNSSKLSTKPKRGRPKKLQSAPTKSQAPSLPELSPTYSEDQDDNGYSEWRRQKNINANHFKIAGMYKKQNTITPPLKNNPSVRPRLNVTLEIKMPPKSNKKSAYGENKTNDDSDILSDVILTPINPESDISSNSSDSVIITTPKKKISLARSRKSSTSENRLTKSSSSSSTSVDRSASKLTSIRPKSDTISCQKSHKSFTINKQSTAQKITLPTETTFQGDPKITSLYNSIKSTANINLVDKQVQVGAMLSEIPLPIPPSFDYNPGSKITNTTASSSGRQGLNEPSELMKRSPMLLKLLHLHETLVPPLTSKQRTMNYIIAQETYNKM